MGWHDYAAIFLMGLLGAGHCIGMCGAFSIAVGVGAPRGTSILWRQISYQLGKATSYVFIGVLLTLAGIWVNENNPIFRLQTVVGWVVGTVMIVYGLTQALEWRPSRSRWLTRWEGSSICKGMAGLWQSPSLTKSMLIGWVNGFLPCGLSLSALLYASSFASIKDSVLGAYAFGLGTLPALLAVSLAGRRLGLESRRWLVRVGGVVLVCFGVLTVVRGLPSVHHWFHEHLVIDPFGQGMHHH
ncbi:MAG TPA: sulfite exporter TauE/SafE family protein [Opitutaceae bacterium]|nr:sulfite exporter TauE/SafE family protein [Opitutaceae bacterium]